MTSADYKEDPTPAVISFCVSNCKLFISWAKWICLESSRMYRMFTIRRSSNFNACYLGHADCSSFNTPTPHFPKSYYMKGTIGTYDDRTQQVLTLFHPEGACLIYTTPLYDHIPFMECGHAQRESSSDTTWRHCIIGSRWTQAVVPSTRIEMSKIYSQLVIGICNTHQYFYTWKRRWYGDSQRAERFGVRTPVGATDLHFSTVKGPN